MSTEQPRDVLRYAVGRALRAPSVHNTQPWIFTVRDGRLTLTVDRTRQLRALDPSGRQLFVSAGCALFNARVGLAARGAPASVHRFPLGPRSDVLAHLDLLEPNSPIRDAPLRFLDAVIDVRSTNRRRFTLDPVAPETVAALCAAAEAESTALIVIAGEEQRADVARLAQRADQLQYADAAYRAELRAWMTTDPNRRDGVPASVVPHVDTGSEDEVPIRDFDAYGAGQLPTHTRSSSAQALLLLATAQDNPAGWLRGGEALEHVLLEVSRHGYAASPITQIVEVPHVRAELRAALRTALHPLVLLRVGRALPTPRTPRRDVEDVLRPP
jgi:nitroreductase